MNEIYFNKNVLYIAEESAAAREELSGQAQMLKNLVEQFKPTEIDESLSQPQSLPQVKSASTMLMYTDKY